MSGLGISPVIACQMTDKDVIEKIHKEYPTTHKMRMPKIQDNRKQAYEWRIQGKPAIDLMEQLLPHMGTRRSARILDILNSWGGRQFTNIQCPNGHLKIGNNVYFYHPKNASHAVRRDCKQCRKVG